MQKDMERISVYMAPGTPAAADSCLPQEPPAVLLVFSEETPLCCAGQFSRLLDQWNPPEGRITPVSLAPFVAGGPLARWRKQWRQFTRLTNQIQDHRQIHVGLPPDGSGWIRPLAALLLARFLGKFTVLDCTSFHLEPVMERWRRLLVPLFKCADRVLVLSPALADRLREIGLPATGWGPIPEISPLRPRDFSSLQPRLLSVQRLEPAMNVACQLRAFRIVKQKYPRAELMIVGDGSQRPALETMIEAERLSGITLIDSADRYRLADHYHQAELFLCSASSDDLPLAPFDALAAGLPVVTTDVGALPDFLTDGETALLVPLNDHVAMADRILTLTENPDLTGRLAAKGRLLAEQLNRRMTNRFLCNLYSPHSIA